MYIYTQDVSSKIGIDFTIFWHLDKITFAFSTILSTILSFRMAVVLGGSPMSERIHLLIEGDTSDLTDKSTFSEFVCNAYDIMKDINAPQMLNFGRISKQNIVHCTGVRRTNAYNLGSTGTLEGVALYPTYSLMNSNCCCNSR